MIVKYPTWLDYILGISNSPYLILALDKLGSNLNQPGTTTGRLEGIAQLKDIHLSFQCPRMVGMYKLSDFMNIFAPNMTL